MWWRRRPKSPVTDQARGWIDEQLDWLVREFGPDLLRREVVLPTPAFFPGERTGTEQDVLDLVGRVCRYMDVDRDRLHVEFYGDDEHASLLHELGLESSDDSPGGHYRELPDGRAAIALKLSMAERPVGLVATVAHELGHVRLLGERRIDPSRADGERLTDLVPVVFGLGVIAANAAVESGHDGAGRGWVSRSGYLSEEAFGYALARYAMLREETDPAWARHLDLNPRTYMRAAARFLRG